jgi:predicted metal-binding membrane protein
MAAAAAPPTPLEALLRRDRAVVLAGLVGLTALAWLHLAHMALGTEAGAMAEAAMAAPARWDAARFALGFAMWVVMMVAMMLPGAAPMVLLFAAIERKRGAGPDPPSRAAVFVLGYLLVWAAFSVAAVAAQWALSEAALLSPALASRSPALGGALFVAAGLYQLTPLKHACLRRCRYPVRFLVASWRPGTLGALRMGLAHGAWCVGCCWPLMGLLFAGGVMNLLWVAAIAGFVLVEKVAPRGELAARASGGLMLGFGAYLLLRPLLGTGAPPA